PLSAVLAGEPGREGPAAAGASDERATDTSGGGAEGADLAGDVQPAATRGVNRCSLRCTCSIYFRRRKAKRLVVTPMPSRRASGLGSGTEGARRPYCR